EEEIIFYGHPNIRAMHEKTIELTKAKDITLRGDCIIGVNANKACIDLSNTIKNKLRENNSLIRISLIVDKYIYSFFGYGNSFLIITDKHDIVIRKSEFVCPRTMAIRCNKASSDIPKDLVQLLKDPKTKGILHINIE
ncbi:MAG: DUF371 domain-containing protein, partial [Thaumarchaeota archaeon]|nr:DUF371 domain-containing protein [Nitrososphaerota archaeon]